MTHTALVGALNASCLKATSKADALEKRFESAMERNSLREAGGLYKSIMALLQAHVARIEDLQPPPADRDALRRYMSAERRMLGYGNRMTDSLLENDISEVQLLVSSYQREQKRRITAAIDIGAAKCGG
jgi:hypothetical protein